jgi:putative heme-binding domain-containing protein
MPPEGPRQLNRLVRLEDAGVAASVTRLIAIMGDGRAWGILMDLASDSERPFEVRREAVSGLSKQAPGQHRLIELAAEKKLLGDTRMLAGALLARSDNDSIRDRAAELLPQPQQKDQKPLAPLDKLAKMKGDANNGMALFRGVATCANCHVIGDHGKEVGPNLSEIGSKLSREAMLVSILDPSAGISHNYEQFNVLTTEGQVITGVKISESDNEVVIRTAEAIDRRISLDDIELIKKSEKSIMPENLHHTFDQKGLLDIVQYMTTLKKKE